MAVEILLYDYVSTDDWWETFNCIGYGLLSAQNIVAQIAAAGNQDLIIRINSVGGSVFDGFAIYNALKAAPGKKTVRIEGLAASISSIIAMAGDEIIICQAAMFMVHKPTIDPFWLGSMDADDLQREADALTQIEAVLNDIYVTRTGLSSTKVQNLIDAETWITPDMAVMLGFANSIEKTITAQPVIAQNAFNHIFKNANPNIRAYANNAFKIKTMSNPNEALLNAVNENTKKTNTLMDWFKNKFGGKTAAQNASATLANGNAIYFNDGEDLAEGTAVFEDEDQSKPLADGTYELEDASTLEVAEGVVTGIAEQTVEPTDSADIIALRAENEELRTALNAANILLSSVNGAMEKLKNVKSTYTPPKAKQEFNRQANDKVDEVIDAKSAIKNIRDRKNKNNK